MTPLELGMAFMLAGTVLLGLSAWLLPGDPMRLTRVLLAVGSALLFQVHVLVEGARADHWPLYAAGLLVLLAVGLDWLRSQRGSGPKPPGPLDPPTG